MMMMITSHSHLLMFCFRQRSTATRLVDTYLVTVPYSILHFLLHHNTEYTIKYKAVLYLKYDFI